jgi:hypothetical protein
MGRRTIAGLIVVAEVALAAYLTLIVWLLSVWMVDDSVAARMVSSDWYIEGARRFAAGVAVSLVFGAVAYVANRRWLTPLLPDSPLFASRAAVLLGCCIGLGGAAGAIQFAVTKPFL